MSETLFGRKIQMKILMDYYNKWKNRLLLYYFLVWIVFVLIGYLFNQLISGVLTMLATNSQISWITIYNLDFIEYFVSLFVEIAAPTSVTIALYNYTLKYINEKGWKKKFPQYDISGEWSDITTYTKQIDDSGWKKLNGKTVLSPVIIRQKCNKVEVKTSVGNDFKWYSLLADWDNKSALRIFYTVEYYGKLQKKGYPESRIGYECMDIFEYGKDNKPCKMVGKFWHCISDDGKPIFMGDVVYKR